MHIVLASFRHKKALLYGLTSNIQTDMEDRVLEHAPFTNEKKSIQTLPPAVFLMYVVTCWCNTYVAVSPKAFKQWVCRQPVNELCQKSPLACLLAADLPHWVWLTGGSPHLWKHYFNTSHIYQTTTCEDDVKLRYSGKNVCNEFTQWADSIFQGLLQYQTTDGK